MARTGRIGEWARTLGPWRIGFGVLGVSCAYGVIGLALAGIGDGQGAASGALWALRIGMAIGAAGSCWLLLVFPVGRRARRAATTGIAHAFLVLWAMLGAWSMLPVWRPSSPADFGKLTLPVTALLFATEGLAVRRAKKEGEER